MLPSKTSRSSSDHSSRFLYFGVVMAEPLRTVMVLSKPFWLLMPIRAAKSYVWIWKPSCA